jgi:putative DNA primase/helicase
MLRVLELPDGQPLQAGTIKKLTGGEKWPIRTLYKGYYEFQPRAKTHMSGNSLPTFDGSDGGMRRRLLMVEWPVTIAEVEQRDFEVVVCELMAEAPGILNWLIAGALDVLQNGLYIAPSIAELTQEQIEEMDPIGQFFRECVVSDPAPGAGVQARDMYAAYRAWSEANAKRTRSETKFGRDFRKLCRRDDSGRIHRYVGVRLENVPSARRGGDDNRDNTPPSDDEIVMR